MSPIDITLSPPPSADLVIDLNPDAIIVLAGNVGPPGPQGQWEAMTQAEYDAIMPNPDTLYVIIQ
jgi:F420-dependent methylenetetrahydromethanopterin dehydrogenase